LLPLVATGNSLSATIKKVFVTQTVFGTFGCALFYFTLALTEGKSINKSVEEVRNKTWPTLLVAWRFWPFISFINFMFIPPNFQVAFVNVISIFWNTYMSYMKNHKVDHGKVIIEEEVYDDETMNS
jgi:protein Mpv17